MRQLGWILLVGLGWLGASATLWATEYRYSYTPKTVYVSQVFPVTIQAVDADPARAVELVFDPDAPVQPLSLAPVQVRNGRDVFYTFYFQARDDRDLRLPTLTITDANRTVALPARPIHTDTLPIEDNRTFCGMIATDCTLLSSQVSLFDADSTLVSVTLQAHEGNPEALHIPGAIEQGIETITREGSRVYAELYFVLPSSEKNITLSYYNTAQRRLIPTVLSTDYHTRSVAAQVALNPKTSPIEKLKQYGTVALALFFALMTWWQRSWFYGILLAAVLGLLYTVYQPKTTLCVQEGSPLLILPTPNSRISTTVTTQLHTPSLGQHGSYYKINYHHGTIGWIRHEDLCTD